MKIHNVAQNSLEWLLLRSGVPTASEWDALVTPQFKIRTGQMPETYLARKVAEKWLGGPLPGFMSIDMDIGKLLEEEAKPWYSLEYGQEIQSVGLVTSDSGEIGCSPDGLIGDDGGIEIKCPKAETHVGYLLDGELPPQYAAQVYGSMLVTGRKWWKFMSYRRHFPALVLTVQWDDGKIQTLADALDMFLEKYREALKRLEEINGGPPRRSAPVADVQPQRDEYADFIP